MPQQKPVILVESSSYFPKLVEIFAISYLNLQNIINKNVPMRNWLNSINCNSLHVLMLGKTENIYFYVGF